MNFLNKFWKSEKPISLTENTQKIKETYIDIIISLTKDKQIDFSVFIDDKIDQNKNILDYSILCSEFLNLVLTNSLKKDTIDILNEQVKNNSNYELINNIISLLRVAPKKIETSSNKTFIKPSEVFAKYNI